MVSVAGEKRVETQMEKAMAEGQWLLVANLESLSPRYLDRLWGNSNNLRHPDYRVLITGGSP